ncbi:MAG: chemotaxis protein CheD [Planctomycetota bacterium]|nr:MAG: chemotaxis protein CheD [Planctomycetota bacterium]
MTESARSTLHERSQSVAIGCIAWGLAPGVLRAVLGSCVGISVYDPGAKAGALAHCLLPEGDQEDAPPAKFVASALSPLIEAAVESGARREALRVKLAGGAALFTGSAKGQGLGARNVEMARKAIAQEGLKIVAESVGGEKGRVMEFDLETGKASVKVIGEEPVVI